MLRTEPCAIDRNCSIQLQISCSAALILEARLANRLTNQQTSQPTNKPTNKQANNQTRIIQVRQHGKRKVLAILDVYGFENVSSNSFEQLTTNYCNEKLHQLITEVVLKEEQEEYILEGLEWNQITYMDNTIVCDLIEKVPQTCFLPHTHTHTITWLAYLDYISNPCLETAFPAPREQVTLTDVDRGGTKTMQY